MKPAIRFVLAAAVAVVLVAIGGALAAVWPFLNAMHVSPWDALVAIFGGPRP